MSTATLHPPTAPVETTPQNLATATEKLAALRFFILLTARREGLESADPEASEHMHNDLVWLRAQYFDMIDDIAMRYGVQQAMDAKQAVEHEVSVPRDWPSVMSDDGAPAWF